MLPYVISLKKIIIHLLTSTVKQEVSKSPFRQIANVKLIWSNVELLGSYIVEQFVSIFFAAERVHARLTNKWTSSSEIFILTKPIQDFRQLLCCCIEVNTSVVLLVLFPHVFSYQYIVTLLHFQKSVSKYLKFGTFFILRDGCVID